jgi:hypothetical protein
MKTRSWLYPCNRVLFCWLWFRLARVLDDAGHQIGWTVIFPIAPWEGWHRCSFQK